MSLDYEMLCENLNDSVKGLTKNNDAFALAYREQLQRIEELEAEANFAAQVFAWILDSFGDIDRYERDCEGIPTSLMSRLEPEMIARIKALRGDKEKQE